MLRIAAFTLIGGLASLAWSAQQNEKKAEAKADELTIIGQLVPNDLPDKQRKHPCKIHTLKLSKDKVYVIDLMSMDFDTYLRVEDSKSKNLAEDDDGGEGLNSRLRFLPPADDTYQIIVTSFAGGAGTYTLKLRVVGKNEPVKKG